MKEEGVRNAFNIALRNKFQAIEEEGGNEEEENETVAMEVNEVEHEFRIMKEAYTEVAEAVLGKPRKKNKPWITEESWRLIDQRQQINEKILSTRSERVKGQLRTKYKEKNKEVKRSLKSDKKKWIQKIAFEAEEAAGRRQMKTLYDLTKKLCNERPRNTAKVLDKEGRLLSKKAEVQKRWTEHFKEVLNREKPPNPKKTEEESEFDFGELIEEIAVDEPTLGEVKDAITKLNLKTLILILTD